MKPSPGCCCVVSAHRFSVSKVNTSMRRHMSGKFADSGFIARLSRKIRPAILSSLAAGFVFASAGSGLSDDLAGFTRVRDDLSQKDRKRVERVVRPASSFEAPEKFEVMQGGAGTSTKLVNRDSLSHFSANLTFKEEETFKLGNALFRKLWVSSPSSTLASDGLGPLFNARACQSCHIKDGRGHPPPMPPRCSCGSHGLPEPIRSVRHSKTTLSPLCPIPSMAVSCRIWRFRV